jgi:cell surface protein SprA
MNDGDLTIFVRIGSDLIQNYYEYEIPLKFTPWFTSPTDLNAIWPEENRFDIDLERLVNFKQERNIEMRKPGSGVFMNMPYYIYDGPNKVTILGSPSISDVKAMMIGIRNPKKTTFNSDDDGESKCAEIWVNELRLTDFNSKSGLAATGRIKTDLADLGNVTLSGLYSTPGYGSIEKKTNERSKEFTRNFDISTNLELGKFFPEKFGIRLPMHFDYSEARLTPKYNQLDPDVILKDDLKNFNTQEQDSLKALNENFIMRKNLNFINVRKDRVGASTKSHFYDIENWDFTYSYSEIYSRNVDIEYELHRTYRGGIGYNFNNNPKNYKPFNNVKFLKGKAFALIRDFNFYLLPKLFSFRTDMDREYSKRVLRNKSQYDVIIEPTYLKKWDWMRNFDLKFDLTTSLKLDYTADIVSYVDELPGGLEKDDPTYDLKQEQIKSQLLSLGTKSQYNHNLAINYTIPINKVPLLDWLNASARYQTNYKWMASPISIQDRLGNQIENSNSLQLNGTASLDKFYNYFPFLKKVNENKKGGARMPDPKAKQKPTADDKAVADTTKTKPKTNYAKIVGNGVLKLLMSFKRASLSYTEGNGIYMPGFKPQPGLVGNNWGLDAPGMGFVFGSQEDIRYKAVQNGWLTTDTLLNTAYMTKFNQQLSFRGSIEPIADFKIELTADRTYSENHQEYFKSDANGDFSSFSPVDQGSFSMSIITWKTAWTKDNDKDENQNFEDLKESRLRIAQRLAENNPNFSGNIVDSTGFPEGYGPTQQNVLLFSFLSAYTGKDAGVYSLNAMPSIPQLNWRITYNGLSKIPALKKYLRSVTITHGYRSTYSINSFQSNVLYKGADGYPTAYDGNNNFISELQISQVSIMEQYSPLITFDMTWINSLMTKFEIKKTRNLSMSFANNQLTEVTSNEFVIGTGYRIKDVKFGIRSVSTGSLSNVKSDLNLRGDFSIRKNKTVLRRIDEDVNQVSTGQQVLSINLSADYMVNSRLNIRVFFDKVINDPYVSSQFHNSTTNGGISLKFTLAQ